MSSRVSGLWKTLLEYPRLALLLEIQHHALGCFHVMNAFDENVVIITHRLLSLFLYWLKVYMLSKGKSLSYDAVGQNSQCGDVKLIAVGIREITWCYQGHLFVGCINGHSGIPVRHLWQWVTQAWQATRHLSNQPFQLPTAALLSCTHTHSLSHIHTMTTALYMLDYGAGNVRSLVNAVNRLGYEIEFVKDPSDILKAQVLLPTTYPLPPFIVC